jgi:hypothetical protein
LPWWCKIIAYICALIFGAVSIFITYIKGVSLGNAQATAWVSSLLVSFLSGILITQPIQVFIITFILVLIFRKPKDELDDLSKNYCDERLAQIQVQAPITDKVFFD